MPSNYVWDESLGFLSWTMEQLLVDQERSLKRQLRFLAGGSQGQRMLGAAPIETVEQFRDQVPLTSYEAYAETLGKQRAEVLPALPSSWLRTSGRSDGSPKWVPLSNQARERLAWATLGLLIAARARGRDDIRLDAEVSILNLTAPPPNLTGTAVAAFADSGIWPVKLAPPNDIATDTLPAVERMALAFAQAGRSCVDFALSYSSVLAGIGGTFVGRHPPYTPPTDLRSQARLLRGRAAAMLGRRSLLPRDIWAPKAIVAGGMDAALFRKQIIDQWGCDPLELLASTDGLFLGMQTWDRTTTTLIPHFNFFEFIPESELLKEDDHATHTPSTLLLDELQLGEIYELVITNLLGGALLRYRTGELLRFAALSNQDCDIQLPQFRYHGQRSEMVEIAGFVRLSEQILGYAIRQADIEAVEWTARKEVEAGLPIVRVRIERVPGSLGETHELEERLNATLRKLDPDWRDMEDLAGLHPLRLQEVPQGTFGQLTASGVLRQGARCARINAGEAVINMLDVLAGQVAGAESSR